MEHLLDIEALRKRLQAMSHTEVAALAKEAKLSLSTVLKIRSGYTEDPRTSKVETLAKALFDMRAS
jgi:transcriptional regulator with XRE-family HTH domain